MSRHERPSRAAPRSGTPAPKGTEVLYGLRSGLAVFQRRRHDIQRIGYSPALRGELTELLRWAASAKLPTRSMVTVDAAG